MHILVTHAYSLENKGDAALLSILIRDIRRQYGDATNITILTIDKVEPGATFEGAALRPAFMYEALNRFESKPLKLIYSGCVVGSTMLWARLRQLGVNVPLPACLAMTCKLYADADMAITVGGGYFRSGPSLVTMVNLWLMLHPLRLARVLCLPTFLYTMSVGPFARKIEERWVARVFRTLPLIILREDTSAELLERLDVSANVVRSVDSGFQFTSEHKVDLHKELSIKKSTRIVGVTVRKWLDADAQERYELAVSHALDKIIQKYDVDVVFIPQVTSIYNNDDDREVSHAIFERMNRKKRAHVMDGDYTHYDVKSMYDSLDFIIGTRFHSVIFSLTSFVPAIAIEYEHKTGGIMRDLGLSEWALKIENVTEKDLTELFSRLVKGEAKYRKTLKKMIPPYAARAADAIKQVDAAYRSLPPRS